MGLRHLARSWNSLAAADPLWAILTWPDKADRRWDLDEFLATGRAEIDAVLGEVGSRIPGVGRRRALDFGCGVGRLTQALAGHFAEVHGVDIARRMLDEARRLDRHPEVCSYHLNETADLGRFPDGHFDLVYSALTLQHMPPRLMRAYIAEFCRVLAPGGAAVFQIAAAPRGRPDPNPLRRGAGRAWTRLHRLWRAVVLRRPSMDMFGISPAEVDRLIQRCGCRMVAAEDDGQAGPEWTSHRYFVERP